MIELKGQIGKYRILRKLGSGGFGTVYLAEDTILRCQRALKIPHRTSSQADKLIQESVLQTRLLDHPHIVKLLTVDIIDNILIMVMEFIEGTDLEKILDKSSSLEIKAALKYFKQILSALAFAHQKSVIHRDIRPSNIMINMDDDVKIADFGTSTLLQDKQFATTKIGSPPYMAPEQFEGKAVFASDIYSAGSLFYEMVTGFPPIILANPMEIYKRAKAAQFTPLAQKNSQVSAELNWLIMKTLAPDLKQRYAHAGDVLNDLERLGKKNHDYTSELKDIQKRIQARESRTDSVCWNCRKATGRRVKVCPYCGEEQ
ncbi:MAG: serine/threonine protein kinase [Acidobacteria bacterium]|jgi:serine/threonine-protein kinase|nr:serine/threonine protein kinase [Acidobacteriota bacterium]